MLSSLQWLQASGDSSAKFRETSGRPVSIASKKKKLPPANRVGLRFDCCMLAEKCSQREFAVNSPCHVGSKPSIAWQPMVC